MTADLQSKVIMTVHFLVSYKNCSLQRFYSFFLNVLPNFAAWCQCHVLPSAGLSNLWHAFTKWHLEFTAVPICLFLLPDQRLCTVKNTHTSDCLETVHELAFLPNNITVQHIYTNRERCEVLTGYLSLGRRPGGDRAIK
jgi:hypothetical protein